MDGKCNNLKNRATRDWGASATGMRRMAAPAYGDPGNRDLHSPGKVETWSAINVLTSFSSGECEPTQGVE